MSDKLSSQPRRYVWFQFDLRTLLALVLVVAAVAAPFTWKAAREQREERKYQAAMAIGATKGTDGTSGKVLRIPEFGPYRFQIAHIPVGADASVLENLAKLEYCEQVILRAVEITDADMPHIRSLQGVRFLDLRSADITDKGLAQLASFDALEELILDHTGITDHSMSTLTSLPRLRKVGVCGTHITERGVKKLTDRKLHVAWATAPSEQHRRIAADLERQGFPVEAHLSTSQLTEYSLTVTVRDLFSLSPKPLSEVLDWPLKSAARLQISGLTIVSSRSLEPSDYMLLSGLQGLEHLTFNGGSFHRDAENLSKMKNLDSLTFNNCGISDKQLPYISELATLERLEINNPQPFIMDGRFNCVSNHGLVHVQKLNKLRRLAFRNIGGKTAQYWIEQAAKQGQTDDELRLTDAGLDHLAEMENLQSLDLSGNLLTAAGLMKLTRLKDFRELRLAEIPLTPQEKSELEQAFPHAKLVFE